MSYIDDSKKDELLKYVGPNVSLSVEVGREFVSADAFYHENKYDFNHSFSVSKEQYDRVLECLGDAERGMVGRKVVVNCRSKSFNGLMGVGSTNGRVVGASHMNDRSVLISVE